MLKFRSSKMATGGYQATDGLIKVTIKYLPNFLVLSGTLSEACFRCSLLIGRCLERFESTISTFVWVSVVGVRVCVHYCPTPNL